MTQASICIPTYNGEPYIGPAINSILKQSFEAFELIISDDNSQDNTPRIIQECGDPRIKYTQNNQRLGLVGNWNRCIDLASNPYIYIFHQDDMMAAADVERKVAILDQNSNNVGLVFSNILEVDSEGAVTGGHWNPCLPGVDTVYSGLDFFRLIITRGNLVPCQTVMVRSDLYKKFGRFDNRLKYTPDLEMWLRLSLHCDVAYIAQPLVLLRRHSKQESSQFLGKRKEILEVWRAFQIIFTEQRQYIPEPEKMYSLAMSHLQTWTKTFLRSSLRQGQLGSALEYLTTFAEISRSKMGGLANLKAPIQ